MLAQKLINSLVYVLLVRNQGSSQWYDIVHFEHKLSWLGFGFPQKASHQWRYILAYKPMIIL